MSTLRVNSIDNLSGTGGSANQVFYRNGSNVLSGSNNLTFDGTTLKNGGYPVLNNYSITYGVNSGTTSYVYPPEGKTISQLIGFIPSSRTIHFSGDVDGNDSLYCYYTVSAAAAPTAIQVVCYNSEQRDTPTVNWMAIWSA